MNSKNVCGGHGLGIALGITMLLLLAGTTNSYGAGPSDGKQNTDINGSASAESHGTVKSFTAYLKAPEVVQVNYSKEPPAITTEEKKRLEEGLNRTHLSGPPVQVKRTPVGPSGLQTVVKNLQAPQAAPGTFTLFKNVPFGALWSTSTIDEPSTASKGRYVFYTGNWYAARSTDGGSTFSYVNPFANMGAGSFCCDQDVIYDKSRDIFIWYRQADDSNGINYFRLGISNNSGNTWAFYSIYPTDINSGWTNQWWDYPHIALSNNYLYITSNLFSGEIFTRSVVLRYSLDELKAGKNLNYNYYTEDSSLLKPRFTFTPVQGAHSTMYWGTHGSNFNFILFSWDEGSNDINWYSYFTTPWNPIFKGTISGAYCPGPDGNNWCARADSRVMTGYVANGTIGFLWMANPSFPATYPYIRGIQIRENDKSLSGQPQMWSENFAYMYPAVSPDAVGNLGMSVFWGGGDNYPNHAVGISDDLNGGSWEFLTTIYGTNGPSDQSWGDYLRVRPYNGSGNAWSATGYALEGGNTSDFIKPRYIIFGRERDAPNNPPESLDLAQFKSDGTTAIPFRGTTDENTVVMKGKVYSVIDNDTFTLDVEIRPVGTGFSGIPNCVSGTAVASGGTAVATCSNLNDSLYYHWQARANYSFRSAHSNWVSAGGNSELNADFIITSINSCTMISLPATYKLKRSINSSADKCIYIISSNVTLDGRGYTVNRTYTSYYTIGVYVSYPIAPTNVTVENLNITDWYYGIYYNNTANGTIVNNNVSSKNNGYGIYLVSSINNTLSGNNASNNYYGIILYSSRNNSLNSNTVSSNYKDGIELTTSNNNTLTKNIASSNGGNGIGLWYSSNNMLSGNNASKNNKITYGGGISLYYSGNNTIVNNTANSSTYGIFLDYSNNNSLNSNTVSSNYYDGIKLAASSNNTLTKNIASSNGIGINIFYSYYSYSNNNNLTENNVISNVDGILIYSNNNTLTNNNASLNVNNGFRIFSASNNTLTKNIASLNGNDGFSLRYSSNNMLSGNNALNNKKGYGVYLSSSSNNTIYNNLFNNTNNFLESSSINTWNITNSRGTNIVGGPNLGGNFWAHPNGTGFSLTCTDLDGNGICDSALTLNVNNTDYLPLSMNFARDNTPPASITGLKNISYASGYINWTWKDSTSPDFAKVMVYINGIFKTNVSKGKQYYNATGLIPNIPYRISTHTVDISGNINSTWVNHTARTKPDATPPRSITNLKNRTYALNYINWTWIDPSDADFSYVKIYIDGRFKTNVARGKKFYNATGFLPNTSHKISTRTVDTSGNINKSWVNHTARTARDKTPPASITNLKNKSYVPTYINWTWTDPTDIDFSKVMVYIDDVFKKNVTKGVRYYNATGFSPNTSHKISTHTVDTSGNINKTWRNHTARTSTVITYRTYGLDFSPYMDGQDPNSGSQISEEQLKARLNIIAPYTRWIRTFGSTNGLEKTGKVAHEKGLNTAIGAWLSKNLTANEQEISNLINATRSGHVDLAIIGSEVLLRGDLSESQLIDYINRVKNNASGIQVTTADAYGEILSHPAVVSAVDVVFVNYYPYWEGIEVERAIAAIHGWHQLVTAKAGNKPVIVSETGWPSCGNQIGNAVPSPENASFYTLNFVSWARENNVSYFYFEAFDESWKAAHEGPQGACWGIWNKDGIIKPGMQDVFGNKTMPDNWNGSAIPGGPGTPVIEFTYMPPYGSFGNLRGQVWHVRPADYKVTVYIKVGNGWWTKPYSNSPLTSIWPDGSWTCDITTGGVDQNATAIVAYLIPNEYNPPLMLGGSMLPDELELNSVAKVEAVRTP